MVWCLCLDARNDLLMVMGQLVNLVCHYHQDTTWQSLTLTHLHMLEGEEHINLLYSSYRANVHCIYVLTISFGDWNYFRVNSPCFCLGNTILILSAADLVVDCALPTFSLKCIAAIKSLQRICKLVHMSKGSLPAVHSNVRKGQQLGSKVIDYTMVALQATGLFEGR